MQGVATERSDGDHENTGTQPSKLFHDWSDQTEEALARQASAAHGGQDVGMFFSQMLLTMMRPVMVAVLLQMRLQKMNGSTQPMLLALRFFLISWKSYRFTCFEFGRVAGRVKVFEFALHQVSQSFNQTRIHYERLIHPRYRTFAIPF